MNETEIPDLKTNQQEPENTMRFGDCVRIAREAAGITQHELAHKFGWHQANLAAVESGTRLGMRWDTAYRMIIKANLGLEHFFPDAVILEAAERIRETQRRRKEMTRRLARRRKRQAARAQ